MSEGDQLSASVRPEDKGRFRVAERPAGTWTVMVRGADGRSALHEDRVTLLAGQTKELTIRTQKE